MSAVPHSNHHTVGVIILHSNVCLGLSNPYISSALWRQRKSKNTAHYIPILLRGFGEAVVTNDWCIIHWVGAKVHVTRCVDLYSGQILVFSMTLMTVCVLSSV